MKYDRYLLVDIAVTADELRKLRIKSLEWSYIEQQLPQLNREALKDRILHIMKKIVDDGLVYLVRVRSPILKIRYRAYDARRITVRIFHYE